jgi:mono/diheme cytochrome c family protein
MSGNLLQYPGPMRRPLPANVNLSCSNSNGLARFSPTWLVVAALLLQTVAGVRADSAGLEFFENRIRPVLVEHCYECHSAKSEKLKGGLLLDSKETLLRGGDTGPAIVPGNPDASLLIKAVRYTDKNVQMPPKDKRLSDQQIADLEAWVKMGAPDPRTGPAPLAGFDKIMADGRTHWAYQPVTEPAVPKVKDRRWPRNPIDHFVLARLEAADVKPAPPADKRALIRRASFVLHGLPPTPQEVEAFLADKSRDAWPNLIDRLLASPRYGERWARHWMDVARYADSRGYAGVGVERRFPYSYTYRDYLIRAFNEDLPYDRFIVEQIAADHLELGSDKRPLAALGFLTLNRHFLGNTHDQIDDRIDVVTRGFMGATLQCSRCHDHKYDPFPTKDYYALYGVFASSRVPEEKPLLGIEPDPKLYQEYLAEREKREKELADFRATKLREALAEVRKRTGDYLLAVHDAAKIQERREAVRLVQSRKLEEGVAARWKKFLDDLAGKHDPVFSPWLAFAALDEPAFAGQVKELAARFAANADKDKPLNPRVANLFSGEPPQSLKEVAERYGKLFQEAEKAWAELSEKAAKEKSPAPSALPVAELEGVRQALYAEGSPANVPENLHDDLLDGAKPRLRELQAKVADVDATHPGAPPRAMAMVDGNPHNVRVFIRGQAGNLGPEVPRQFLEVLSRPEPKPFTKGSGRLELAQAIASRDNPLTARVLVNRVWMHHFGEGLVRTPSDFGTRSDPPTHPELLDWLASQFMGPQAEVESFQGYKVAKGEGGTPASSCNHATTQPCNRCRPTGAWSLKKLHKLILTSATWQMSGDAEPRRAADYALKDPNNFLLWRQNRQRLDFEAMRDSLLFAAGRLDVAPASQPVDLWKQPFTTKRSVYGYIDRQNLPGVFRAFDFANPDASASRRFSTTVPQQALFLMNSPFVVEQAKALLERPAVAGSGSDESRVRAMYQIAWQREPSRDELKLALAFVQAAEPPQFKPEPVFWQYGYGRFDEGKGRVAQFRELPHWTGSAWQGGPELPDRRLGWIVLHADGGHAGEGPDRMTIRRWIAPRDATVVVESTLAHGEAEGDGVRGRIVSGRHGLLAEAVAHNQQSALNVARVEVQAGDTLDFVVDYRGGISHDSFGWAPVIRLPEGAGGQGAVVWSAKAQFRGPGTGPDQSLTPWQKFAQVLLLANEFMFVD